MIERQAEAQVHATSGARFVSILSPRADDSVALETREPPAFFHDLQLGRVVEAITAGRQEYGLAPFFHTPLTDVDAVLYRQEVMRDVELSTVREALQSFAERMRRVRQIQAFIEKLYYKLEKQRWRLAAAEIYTEAVERLARDLHAVELASRGLRAFREDVEHYAACDEFRALATDTRALTESLAAIRYCLTVRDAKVTVLPYNGEVDYSVTVEETFRKFQQGATKDYRQKFRDSGGLNHVEAQILDRVALLNPEPFAALARFWETHSNFVDATIARFDQEVQFYVAYMTFTERLGRTGLPFCFPHVSESKDVLARETFDVALADKLVRESATVVTNDFLLQGTERVLVVTGPNQGGKTTFARLFGQLHYLASLGLPVPGREARLFLCDRLLTHFEREEDITNLRGKLEDDLVRVHELLERATPRSIVILNEIFSSTTVEDALFLGREVLSKILDLDALCVCVTFLDELSSLGGKTVSMVAAIDPRDPAVRTFKIERCPADGLAYALAIAEKHRVTYRWLKVRIRT